MRTPRVISLSRTFLAAMIPAMLLLGSCKQYLDLKPDKKLAIPTTLDDAQALLDYYRDLNALYPSTGAESDDDFYLLDSYYDQLSTDLQARYRWDAGALNDQEWGYLYTIIQYANLALETVKSSKVNASELPRRDQLEGAALFFRGYTFYQVAEYFAAPYNAQNAGKLPGIPLRLTSDVNAPNKRATLEQSWSQIIRDLKLAAALLPEQSDPVSRPDKPAAFAALARAYLSMHIYDSAYLYADSSLQLYSTLLDYNELDSTSSAPFAIFNKEVVFHSQILGGSMLNRTHWRVDSTLYRSYATDDLRRVLFFTGSGSYPYGFKGSYNGWTGLYFNGIAVDEVYLMRAECEARLGMTDAAMKDLNTLLKTRWRTSSYKDLSVSSSDEALDLILTERRKELVGRSLRWFDLRRLNEEKSFARSLQRNIHGKIYSLPAGDPRYTFPIPQAVIDYTGMQQNKR